MFKTAISVDIGSTNSRFATKEDVFVENTCIALQAGEELRIAAIGTEAANKRGSALVRPVSGGAPANTRMLAIFLRRMCCDITRRKNPSYIEFHASMPRAIGVMKHNSFKQAAKLAGFREIELHDSMIMGAIGAGFDIFSGEARMLVDIGSESITCGVVANGGILWEGFLPTGSNSVNRSIQGYFREKHRLLIGDRIAEIIKQSLNSSSFAVDGRSVENGLPATVEIDPHELRETATRSTMDIISAAADAIKALQVDAAADLIDNGITLIGGGARQYGLSAAFENELGIPTMVASNAETAIIDGMREYLFDRKRTFNGIRREYTAAASE